ncbi:hypothetical protein RDV84_18985 [Lysobacter yananisis]|uniref:Uncharacterized protein n=1 Tax=Lysobacter yananisis TaxID=1003114 RepID=A0ABY9P4S1_9GAMM|nr:hypothetical protein [Lysobacter yananisis]WMT02030.1 hypothetical protein RDV84_18985 [Lysobacter yananisis]
MSPSALHAPPPLDPQDLLATLRDWAERIADADGKAIDDYLDRRDREPFDGQWTRADAALRSHKRRLDPQRVQRAQAESAQLRQAAFVAAMQAAGHAELAAYLADDAALIYESEVLGLCSDWVRALHRSYLHAAESPAPGPLESAG